MIKIKLEMKPLLTLGVENVLTLDLPEVHDLIRELQARAFTGLLSVENVGLLVFVEGGYTFALMYYGEVPDNVHVWIKPLSRSIVNLILTKGDVTDGAIVFSNGSLQSFPLPSLGVNENVVGIAFLHDRKEFFRKVIAKWLQKKYPDYRVVEREPENASIVIFGKEHLDEVRDLNPGTIRILVLERGESVDREELEKLGILVLEHPYTPTKFFRLLEGLDQ